MPADSGLQLKLIAISSLHRRQHRALAAKAATSAIPIVFTHIGSSTGGRRDTPAGGHCGRDIARGQLTPTRVGAYADGFRLLLRQLSANDGIAVNVPGLVAGSTPLIDSDRGRMNHDDRRPGRGELRGVSGEMRPPRYCSAECLFCLAMASAPAVAVRDSQSSARRLAKRGYRLAWPGQRRSDSLVGGRVWPGSRSARIAAVIAVRAAGLAGPWVLELGAHRPVALAAT